jgi:glycosyltransferase involved in cell wall biosynthesis
VKPIILIPVYNEEKQLDALLSEMQGLDFDILVIDDGSKDGTADVAKAHNVKLIRNEVNLGKGTALRKGFEYALERGYDLIFTMDGDGQHRPEDLLKIYEHYLKSGADIIIGNRMWNPVGMPLIRKITNKVMSKIISFLTKTYIPDSQCGLKLIRREVLRNVDISSRKFEIESEILIRAIRKGYKVESMPILSVYHAHNSSKIRPIRDTIRFLRFIAKIIFLRK